LPVPVRVAVAEQKDVPIALGAIGNVEAFQTVAVRSEVEGQLAEVKFDEGEEVRAGDLLFVIDPGPFLAALAQAEANLAKAEAEAQNAEVQAKRFGALVKDGIVSRDEYDQVRTDAASKGASAGAARAEVANAKLRLGYCYIRSPIDGRVGRVLVHRGNVVKENDTTLAVINQVRPIYVAFTVPEHELPAVRRYLAERPLPVTANFPDGGAPGPTGTLVFIDNAVDRTTGSVLLKARFENGDEMLWPGQFVDVTLTLTTDPAAILVPAVAVQPGQEGTYVFVIGADGVVEYRPVRLSRTQGGEAVIASGVAAGERVVTEGFARLGPGVPVTVRDGAEDGGQASP